MPLSSAPPPESHLRVAGPHDSRIMALLHAVCFPDAPWSAAVIQEILTGYGGLGICASDEEQAIPIGFVLCRTVMDEAEILSFGVAPPWRRFGIGWRLLQAALSAVAQAGAASMFLEVAEDNLPAQTLYARAGFTRVGRRPGYYSHTTPPVAALILKKAMTAGIQSGNNSSAVV